MLLSLLCGRIDHILHKAAARCRDSAADCVGSMLPWTDIITACVEYQLTWLRYHKVSCCSALLLTLFTVSAAVS